MGTPQEPPTEAIAIASARDVSELRARRALMETNENLMREARERAEHHESVARVMAHEAEVFIGALAVRMGLEGEAFDVDLTTGAIRRVK